VIELLKSLQVRRKKMASKSVSVKEVLDSGRFSGYQIWVCFLCFCLTFFDGFDLSLVGVSLPKIADFLHSKPTALGMVMSAGNVGALIGALVLGLLADRFGRKKMLLVSAFMFGIFTLSISFIQSVEQLVALRFLAGLGLGGAVPNALAFGSEYAPSHKRATLATMMYAGVAVGAVFAGLAASYLLPHYGWQSLFLAGGIVACLIGVFMVFFMPETLAYLVQKGRDKDRTHIYKIVSKIAPTYAADKETVFVSSEKKLPGAPVVQLFKEGRALNTLLLWMAFIVSYYLLWLILSWTPTLLKKSGASPQEFSLAFACINLGSAVAIIWVGMLMDKFNPLNILKIGFFLAFVSVMVPPALLQSLLLFRSLWDFLSSVAMPDFWRLPRLRILPISGAPDLDGQPVSGEADLLLRRLWAALCLPKAGV
jgi:AAHS family 4-hydroxybenzoate transporter-like MFS transporter